jgi:hypothetical protein
MKNKLMTAFGILLITSILTTAASARIGETLEQCRTRYGAEVKSSASTATGYSFFSKNGFLISIQFTDGKAAMLTFRKTTPGEAITPAQLDALLASNAGGSKWQADAKSTFPSWQTEDRKVLALYLEKSGMLTIITAAQTAKNKAQTEASEKEQVKGF